MNYIDPHIHMISRTTDDYDRMAKCGCVAISEPAFWAGFDRGTAVAFHDYFRQLTEYEPRRAAQFHVTHFCWLCINAKEAENVSLSREVIAMIPEFLSKPNVLGIGEHRHHPATGRQAAEQSPPLGDQPCAVGITRIGQLVPEPGLWQTAAQRAKQPLAATGYQHGVS